MTKGIDGNAIARNRVITKITGDDALEPRTNLPDRLMHARSKRDADPEQGCPEPFAGRFASNHERTVGPALFADMDEPQKRKRLRLFLSPLLPSSGRMAAKLDQSRFLIVKFQAKLHEPFPKC